MSATDGAEWQAQMAEQLKLEAWKRRAQEAADLAVNLREWVSSPSAGTWSITIDRRDVSAVEAGHFDGCRVLLKGGSSVVVYATHGALVAWWRGA